MRIRGKILVLRLISYAQTSSECRQTSFFSHTCLARFILTHLQIELNSLPSRLCTSCTPTCACCNIQIVCCHGLNMWYLLQYREDRFRTTSESTNQRVLWWAIAQTLLLVIVGFWQMRHLRSFFEAKKLV